MASTDVIAHARRSLARAVGRCNATDGEHFPIALLAVDRLCRDNAVLRDAIAELSLEHEIVQRRHGEQSAQQYEELLALRGLAEKQDPTFARCTNADYTVKGLDSISEDSRDFGPVRWLVPGAENTTKAAEYGRYLEVLLAGLPKDSPARSGVAAAEGQVHAANARVAWLYRERLNHALGHGGAVWEQLAAVVEWINPHPDRLSWQSRIVRDHLGLFSTEEVVWREMRPSYPAEEARKRIVARLAVLESEIEVRLGVRASHASTMARYVRSAVLFRRKALQELASEDTRVSEARLAEDAASFLFSEGHDVLTEVSLGVVRPDIVSFTTALLVDAKVYRTPARAKSSVVNGIVQVLDYASDFAGFGMSTDNYLLVYRLGGARVGLPREPLRIGAHTVRIEHVDLAPSQDRGSRAKLDRVLNAGELRELVLAATKKAARKSTSKKSASEKNASKKSTSKKNASKKSTSKKSTSKKSTSKKSASKKIASKKSASKSRAR